MDEIKNTAAARPHNIIMRDRKVMTVTGVSEIISFDENSVSLDIADFQLNIDGTGLRIESFSNESGEASVTGHIDAIVYAGRTEASYRRGILKRIFAYDDK